MDSNQPTKRYLVSVVLAAFWGFVGTKEWYNGNTKLALVRLGSTIVTVVAGILALTTVIPGVIANLLIAALAVWVIIDSVLTHRAASPQLREQKSRATQADKNFASYSLVIGLVLSLFIGGYSLASAVGSLSLSSERSQQQIDRVEAAKKFAKLQLGNTPEEAEAIIGQELTCQDERQFQNIASGAITYQMTCSYGKPGTEGITMGGSASAAFEVDLTFGRDDGVETHSLIMKRIKEDLLK